MITQRVPRGMEVTRWVAVLWDHTLGVTMHVRDADQPADESPVVRRVRAVAHERAGKQAHRVGALGLIQVLVRLFLSPLKTVCSRSTPHIITIARSEKANSK